MGRRVAQASICRHLITTKAAARTYYVTININKTEIGARNADFLNSRRSVTVNRHYRAVYGPELKDNSVKTDLFQPLESAKKAASISALSPAPASGLIFSDRHYQ